MAIIDDAVKAYGETPSVKFVSRALGIGEQKARKLLITAGILQPEMSREILLYRSRGLELSEIAEKLGVTVKAVQSYLPYARSPYNQPTRSRNAVIISRCRARKRAK